MGFSTNLKEVFSFIYKVSFDNGLTEHELDHVLVGRYSEKPVINPQEVASYKWMTLEAIKEDIKNNSSIYTAWFKIIFKESYSKLTNA